MKHVICHLTVSHRADDTRIFAKECRALSKNDNYQVVLCAPGSIPFESRIIHYKISEPSSWRLKRLIFSQFIGFKVIFQIKADTWHIHDLELLPVALLLVLLKKQVIWDSHEDYFNQFSSKVNYRSYIPNFLAPLVRSIVYFFLRYIDKNALAVVAATEKVSKQYSNANLVVVGNEAIVEEFKLCNPKFENNVVIFIGSPDSSSCYMEIVDAMREIPDLKLVVACRSMSKSLMDYSLEKLNLRFEYRGWLQRHDLAQAISNSLVGLVTYSDDKNHQDNQPTKFYEFCAAGLPIIATPTGFNIELIKLSGAGVLSDNFTSNSIKTGLKELISSKERWINHSKSGRTWSIDNGNWAKSEAKLLELYASILD